MKEPRVCTASFQKAAAAQAKFEAAWGVPLSPNDGLNLNVMMKGLQKGDVKGLYIMGEDILLSEPNTSALEEGLNKAEFIVVQDILPTETMRYADVVLPAEGFAEKDGTLTNIEGRVQKVNNIVPGPGQSRPDWSIIDDIAFNHGVLLQEADVESVLKRIQRLDPIGIASRDLRECLLLQLRHFPETERWKAMMSRTLIFCSGATENG